MKQTAIVVAPGRGTYNAPELGYLARHHAGQSQIIQGFDTYRAQRGQPTLTELDGTDRFQSRVHTLGDNASALIHTCAYLDFLAIDRDRYDVLGVTGNSMGWYIALACAGALSPMDGMHTVDTMGTLMQQALIGGQLIYPIVDDDWQQLPDQHAKILKIVAQINTRPLHELALSIDLGGMLVLAGNEAGLDAFATEIPVVQDRFPMRLPNHAAFHTKLQAPVAEQGRMQLPASMYRQPDLPLIDGRGAIWYPMACDIEKLWDYTLGHQVVEPYEFATAIRTATHEFMPDIFIVLGPGTTLGGAVAQSLVRANWRGLDSKAAFKTIQEGAPRLISMGLDDQRDMVVA